MKRNQYATFDHIIFDDYSNPAKVDTYYEHIAQPIDTQSFQALSTDENDAEEAGSFPQEQNSITVNHYEKTVDSNDSTEIETEPYLL